MQELKYLVWLSRIEYLKKKTVDKALGKYKTLENVFNEKNKNEFIKLGISEKMSEELTNAKYKQNLDKYIEYMQKNNIELISFENECYPKDLREIYDSPISLYIKGNKNILNNKAIAIIGCRNCTKYGETIANKFAYNLAKSSINVISGGARGIDTVAHIGAIQANGQTISVIGSGLDITYPPENKKIFEKIVALRRSNSFRIYCRNKTKSQKLSCKK